MKNFLLTLGVALLVGVLVLTACTAPAPTTPSTTTPTTPSTTPPPILVRHSEETPENSWVTQNVALPWLKAMEDSTEGRVKFQLYPGQTLVKTQDAWDGVLSGVADSACVMTFMHAGKFPLSDVLLLPLLPIYTADHAAVVFWELWDRFPTLREEFKEVQTLAIGPSGPYFLITTKKQVKTLEDIKGLKLRAGGGPATEALKMMGAVPVTMGMADTYLNLQKGVIDGMLVPWLAMDTFKIYEVVKYYTYLPFSCMNAARVMNLNTWNKISAKDQEAILAAGGGVTGSRFWSKNQFDSIEGTTREYIKNKSGYDMIEYTPSEAEMKRWVDATRPIWDKWVSDTEAMGHPEARELLDTLLEVAEATKP
ncbi:MAG: TRAP transporter substrate-binding protein [Dehalococcoidia bacterium]|nr:TRAP transporter substrate-binding protein [Dehalococcoidia bacterium]